MNIAIIGAGHVGRSLGVGWARAGHVIRYGVKDPEDDQHADLLKAVDAASHSGAAPDTLTVAEAAEVADAILLAVPWKAMPDVMERIAPVSTGKLVIDAINPLAFGPQGELRLAIGFSTSGGEEVAADVVLVPHRRVRRQRHRQRRGVPARPGAGSPGNVSSSPDSRHPSTHRRHPAVRQRLLLGAHRKCSPAAETYRL